MVLFHLCFMTGGIRRFWWFMLFAKWSSLTYIRLIRWIWYQPISTLYLISSFNLISSFSLVYYKGRFASAAFSRSIWCCLVLGQVLKSKRDHEADWDQQEFPEWLAGHWAQWQPWVGHPSGEAKSLEKDRILMFNMDSLSPPQKKTRPSKR